MGVGFLKSTLIQDCRDQLERRCREIMIELEEIAQAISNETKSSAGDKHETSRALMQNQREQSGQRLKETEATIDSIRQIDLQKKYTSVQTGSLVTTSKGLFLISIGYGSIKKDNITCFLISLQSPLGLAMKGKKQGDTFQFNNLEYRVLEVG